MRISNNCSRMTTLHLLVLLVTGSVGAWGGVVVRRTGSDRLGIYHGESADVSNYPYVASVTYVGSAHCTGVIISSTWVLTTGDCVDGYDAYYTIIEAGEDEATSGSQQLNVYSTSVHPKYNSTSGDYNFGLLQIDGEFSWTETVRNVSLPSSRVDPATWLSVVGYGASDENDNSLKEGKMAVVQNRKCEKLYESDSTLTLTKRMGCVYNKGKTTVCSGDFGAPLVKDDVLYYLAASVASSGACSSSAYPVVTADVFSVVEWISSVTGGNQ